jgi:hypothetical protein
VFHLDQALRKLILKMKNPGMPADEFSRFKGHVLREVHELVCGEKGKVPITAAEFEKRQKRVSALLWKRGMHTLAARWDYYVKIKDKWAPYARWEVCKRLFGDSIGDVLPMLVRSNNVLESFFKVLKHFLLHGKSAFTFFAMVKVWVSYQNRLIVNMLGANIDPRGVLRGTGVPVTPEIESSSDEESSSGDEEDEEEETDDEDSGAALYQELERGQAEKDALIERRFYGLVKTAHTELGEMLER